MANELKHFLDTQDFSKEELLGLIELIRLIKEADKQGAYPKTPGRCLVGDDLRRTVHPHPHLF